LNSFHSFSRPSGNSFNALIPLASEENRWREEQVCIVGLDGVFVNQG
jgi:hypothetical protein